MQLTVESIKTNDKSIVLKAGGKEYFAKKDSGISQGMTIEAETEDSDYNGKHYCWVKKWKQVQQTAATPSPQTGAGSGLVSGGSGGATWWMPFVSNTVAHAIQAGIIQNPQQIDAWAVAARLAAQKLETEIPF